MGLYQRRALTVEARCLGPESAASICEWVRANGGNAQLIVHANSHISLEILTLEGTMTADPGDWVIKEPYPTDDRKFYPCKPHIFKAGYYQVGNRPWNDPAKR